MAYTLRDRYIYAPLETRQFFAGGPGVARFIVRIENAMPEGLYPLLDVSVLTGLNAYLPGLPAERTTLFYQRQWVNTYIYRIFFPVSQQLVITRIDRSIQNAVQIAVWQETE